MKKRERFPLPAAGQTGNSFASFRRSKQPPTWKIAIDKSTKGDYVVGDKVTVCYSMTATEIETKPAKPPKADKKTDK